MTTKIIYKTHESGLVTDLRYVLNNHTLESDEKELSAVLLPEISTLYSDSYKTTFAEELLREERDRLLLLTDYWASADLTMSDAQTAYRKALRDIPSTASPKIDSDGKLINVTWPTKP